MLPKLQKYYWLEYFNKPTPREKVFIWVISLFCGALGVLPIFGSVPGKINLFFLPFPVISFFLTYGFFNAVVLFIGRLNKPEYVCEWYCNVTDCGHRGRPDGTCPAVEPSYVFGKKSNDQ